MKPKVKQSKANPPTPVTTPKSKKLRKKGEPSNLAVESNKRAVPDLPDVGSMDIGRMCVRYSALLDRDPEIDPATVDELDPLQHEIEDMMLHNMDLQTRITDALSAITNGEFPTTSQLRSKSSRLKPIVHKRGEPDSDHPSKLKIRGADGASPSTIRVPKSSYNKARSDKLMKHVIPVTGYDKAGRKRTYFWPQNQLPDKFWTFVAEYAPKITVEDINFLHQRIRDCSHDKLLPYLNMPALGKHYSIRTKEDNNYDEKGGDAPRFVRSKRVSRSMSAQQQVQVNGNGPTTPGLASPTGTTTSATRKRKLTTDNGDTSSPSGRQSRSSAAAHNGTADSAFTLGHLTERLVQALVEENNGDEHKPVVNGNAKHSPLELQNGGGPVSPSKALVKSLNLGNMSALERRIKKELEAQGFLEDEDDGDDDDSANETSPSPAPGDDEVAAELSQRQLELRQIAESNRRRLADILDKASRALEMQQLQQQVEAANNNVCELYKRFYSLVPKRKPCTKKERDQMSAALEQRKQLMGQLHALSARHNTSSP